jgi:hypothetical protein
VGSFQAFLITSLISRKSTLLTWIDHEFENEYWLWTVRIALGILFLFFELFSIKLMLWSLKYLGAVIGPVCGYIWSFFFANFFAYIQQGSFPGYYSFVGMGFLIVGVLHICGFGTATLLLWIKRQRCDTSKFLILFDTFWMAVVVFCSFEL